MPKEPNINLLASPAQVSELDGYLHLVVEEEALGGFRGQEEAARADPRAQAAVAAAMRRREGELGAAAQQYLEHQLWGAMSWARFKFDPAQGRFSSFAFAVERTVVRRFRREFKPEHLRRELDDEQLRDQARRDDRAMVNYLKQWRRRIVSLQHARAARWHVPEMPPDEVQERLEVELLAAVKSREIEGPEFGRPGVEATFLYLARQIDKLRCRRVLVEVSYGPEHDDVTVLSRHEPSPEALAIQRDAELLAEEIFANEGELGLSRVQLRWLKAFMFEARGAAGQGQKFNAARAAANLGRDRASASRMLKAIRGQLVARYGEKEDLLP